MASERYLSPLPVVRVVEVVVSLWIRAESRIVDLRRERQRGATAPGPDELRGEQLPFSLGASIRAEKTIERTDARLIFPETHVAAVATEHVRLRYGQRHAGLTGITKDEFSCLDRPALTRQRGDTALD